MSRIINRLAISLIYILLLITMITLLYDTYMYHIFFYLSILTALAVLLAVFSTRTAYRSYGKVIILVSALSIITNFGIYVYSEHLSEVQNTAYDISTNFTNIIDPVKVDIIRVYFQSIDFTLVGISTIILLILLYFTRWVSINDCPKYTLFLAFSALTVLFGSIRLSALLLFVSIILLLSTRRSKRGNIPANGFSAFSLSILVFKYLTISFIIMASIVTILSMAYFSGYIEEEVIQFILLLTFILLFIIFASKSVGILKEYLIVNYTYRSYFSGLVTLSSIREGIIVGILNILYRIVGFIIMYLGVVPATTTGYWFPKIVILGAVIYATAWESSIIKEMYNLINEYLIENIRGIKLHTDAIWYGFITHGVIYVIYFTFTYIIKYFLRDGALSAAFTEIHGFGQSLSLCVGIYILSIWVKKYLNKTVGMIGRRKDQILTAFKEFLKREMPINR